MSNILDYIDWRGDLPFEISPFCDVDALIFCRLSYIPFDNIVPDKFTNYITMNQAVKKVIELAENDALTFHDDNDLAFLKKILESKRFSNIDITGYVNIFSEEIQKQFSALTLLMPDGTLYIAFRGTDGTLVGWKEDFNMSFIDTVPAQSEAVKYLENAADSLSGKIRVGGHSKGGNLAVYSAAFCNAETQKRLIQIRNFDGPGFNEKTIASDKFKKILPIVRTYLPQSSIVGMLLEHAEDFTVVFSTSSGILQHDIYTWEVEKYGLVCVDRLSNSSQFIDATLKDWLDSMTMEQREKMIDGIYEIMVKSDISSTQNIFSRKNLLTFFKNFENTDDETRSNILQAMKILKKSLKNSIVFTLNNAKKDTADAVTVTDV